MKRKEPKLREELAPSSSKSLKISAEISLSITITSLGGVLFWVRLRFLEGSSGISMTIGEVSVRREEREFL